MVVGIETLRLRGVYTKHYMSSRKRVKFMEKVEQKNKEPRMDIGTTLYRASNKDYNVKIYAVAEAVDGARRRPIRNPSWLSALSKRCIK